MAFHGFSKEALLFLEEIRQNNTKEWFEANRERYDALILEPSRAFVVEMGEHLQALVPTINAYPKVNGSLFRIYRDIRFRKDKRPLKSRIGVIFWQGGGKRMQSSSFYLHFDPETLFFAAGIRGFSDETLRKYREYIKEKSRRERLSRVMDEMRQRGFMLPEPKYKRIPREFEKEISHPDLTRYGAIYCYKEMTHPDAFFSSGLCDFAYELYAQMLPMQQWVYEMTYA